MTKLKFTYPCIHTRPNVKVHKKVSDCICACLTNCNDSIYTMNKCTCLMYVFLVLKVVRTTDVRISKIDCFLLSNILLFVFNYKKYLHKV